MPKRAERLTEEVETVCPYCGCGCGIYLGIRNGQVVNVRGRRDGTVNNGSLCVKGRYGLEFIHHEDRLKTPLIKRDGDFTEATWDEALDLVADRLVG